MDSIFSDVPEVAPDASTGLFDDVPESQTSLSGEQFQGLIAAVPEEHKARYAQAYLQQKVADSPFKYLSQVSGNTINDAISTVAPAAKAAGRYFLGQPTVQNASQFVQDVTPAHQPSRTQNVAAGVIEGTKGLAQGMYDQPALIPLFEVPLAGRIAGAYFATKGATDSLPKEYQNILEADYAGDTAAKDEAIGRMGVDGILTTLAAIQTGKSGLANEVPGLRKALVKRVVSDYSPEELKAVGDRVRNDTASVDDLNLVNEVRFGLQGERQRPGQFTGVSVTREVPKIKADAINDWLGIDRNRLVGVTLNRGPVSEAPAQGSLGEPVPTAPSPAPQPQPVVPAPEPAATSPEFIVREYPTGYKLESIGVPAGQQGKGTGTKLIQELIQKSEQTQKPIYLTASALTGKQDALNRFYTRLGFEQYKSDPLSGKPMFRYLPKAPNEPAQNQVTQASAPAPLVSLPAQPVAAPEAQAGVAQPPSGGEAVDLPKSSTQLTLPAPEAAPFKAFAASIPDAEVYHKKDASGKEDYGIETEPHVTVLYGLTEHNPALAAQALAGKGPVTIKLGKMSVFKGEEYDVLKVEVQSPQLRALNKVVSKLPNENKFPDYTPHLTLAYLKKGEGKKYEGDTRFAGKSYTFNSVTFSPPSELRSQLGRPEMPLSAPSPIPEQLATAAAQLRQSPKGSAKAARYQRQIKLLQQRQAGEQATVKESLTVQKPAAPVATPPPATQAPQKLGMLQLQKKLFDSIGPSMNDYVKKASREQILENYRTASELLKQIDEEIAYRKKAKEDYKGLIPMRYDVDQVHGSLEHELMTTKPAEAPPVVTLAPKENISNPVAKGAFQPKEAKQQKKYLLESTDKAIEAAPDVPQAEIMKQWQASKPYADKQTYEDWTKNNPYPPDPQPQNYGYNSESPEFLAAKAERKAAQAEWNARRDAEFAALAKPYRTEMIEGGTVGDVLKQGTEAAFYRSLPHVIIEVPGDGTFSIVNTKDALKAFKERAKSFPTTAPRVAEPSQKRSTQTPVPALGDTSKENVIKAASLAVSTDAQRYILTYLWSDGKQTVATNGRWLVRILKGIGGTEKNPKLFDTKGKSVEVGEFPNWKQVMPAEENLTKIFTGLDTAQLWTVLKQAEQMTSERSKAVKVYRNPDKSLGISSSAPDEGEYQHNIQDGAKLVGAWDAQYLMEAIEAARRTGSDKIDIYWNDELSPMVIRSKTAEAVIMPVRLEAGGPDADVLNRYDLAPTPEARRKMMQDDLEKMGKYSKSSDDQKAKIKRLKKQLGEEDVQLSRDDRGLPFYSRIIRTIEQSPQQKASGAQWKATIRNSKLGVNRDEFDLTRVEDLEDSRAYTKDEVLEYLRGNQVQVKDVTLGQGVDVEYPFGVFQVETGNQLNATKTRAQAELMASDPAYYAHDLGISPGDTRELEVRPSVKNHTHFSTYVLPGGKSGSYREVLLTVPTKTDNSLAERFKELGDEYAKLQEEGNASGAFIPYHVLKASGAELTARDLDILSRVEEIRSESHEIEEKIKALKWTDGHSQYGDVANPIVRLRFNERTLPDDTRMLFLEEIQPPQKGQFEKMPVLFQKNWREIGLKWAIRHASENGFDSIGWTTGEQQIQRYPSVQKTVDKITWGPLPDNRVGQIVKIFPKSGARVEVITGENGKIVQATDQRWVGNLLEQVIGKEIATKISNQHWGMLEGDGLKFGGEGLKKLYDQDFRNVVNNLPLVKKSGQKVFAENILSGETHTWIVLDGAGDDIAGPFDSQRVAAAYIDSPEGRAANAMTYEPVGQRVQVHALRLTPEMTEAAMRGQPLFSTGATPGPLRAESLQQHFDSRAELGPFPVTVVQSYTDLPPDLLSEIARKAGNDTDNIAGAYWNGQVFMIADRVPSLAAAEALERHEIVHGALQAATQGEYTQLIDGVLEYFRGRSEYEELKQKYLGGREPQSPGERITLAEEIIARVAENPNLAPSLWQRIVAWIRAQLKKLGWAKGVSEAEIKVALQKVWAWSRRGEQGQGSKLEFNIDPESVAEARKLLRNPSQSQAELVKAIAAVPDNVLYGHEVDSFKALSKAAQREIPGAANSVAKVDEFRDMSQPASIIQEARARFPGNPEAQQQLIASVFFNGERFIAERAALQKRLTEVIADTQKLIRNRARIEAGSIKSDAAKGLAEQMIEEANDQLDQRIAAERVDTEKEVLKRSRELINEFLAPERMSRVIEALSKLDVVELKQFADDVKNPTSTLATLKAKWKAFDGVSEDVAKQAIGVMRVNAALYDQLITAKNSTNPQLQADLAKLSQKRVSTPVDVTDFMKRYAEVAAISAEHEKLLAAVNLDLSKQFKKFMAVQQARGWMERVFTSPQFQRNMEEAIKVGGDLADIDDDNGLTIRYPNPNLPEDAPPQVLEYRTPLDQKMAEKNQQNLEQVAGWLLEYTLTGPDPLLRATYARNLAKINLVLKNPMHAPATGNRLTRGTADLTRIFSINGLTAPPDVIGRMLGGEIGERIRVDLKNADTVHQRALNLSTQARVEIQPKVQRAAKSHDLSIDEWVRQVNEPILESYMSVGDRQLDVGSSLPGGMIVTAQDMAAVSAQSRYAQEMLKMVQLLPVQLSSFLFAAPKISQTLPGGRKILRTALPISQHSVPRRISSVGLEIAKKWKQIDTDNPDNPVQRVQQKAQMIDDPKYRDIFLSYFRSFTDPTFVVETPLRDAILAVNRDIFNRNTPATFRDWIDRIQDKAANQTPSQILSKTQVQSQVLKDLDKVMNLVASDLEERDQSAKAPTVDIIDTQNFMTRPRGDTIALKGMYDLSIVTNGQILRMASSVTEPFMQALLNDWRAAATALQEKQNQYEARIKAGESRSKVNADTEAAMNRKEEFYKLSELPGLLNDLTLNINRMKNLANNTAAFEQQAMWPRILQTLKLGYLTPVLQGTPVAANNFTGGIIKGFQMDLMYNLNRLFKGIKSPLINYPISTVTTTASSVRDLIAALTIGTRDILGATAAGGRMLKLIERNKGILETLLPFFVRGYERANEQYRRAQELGLVDYAPFLDKLKARIELAKLGGDIRGNSPTAATRRMDQALNIIDFALETGLPFRPPASWSPSFVDNTLNYATLSRAIKTMGQLQLNVLEAYQRRVNEGEDPNTIRLEPWEILGRSKGENFEQEFTHLNNLLSENLIDIQASARNYYHAVQAAAPELKGQVTMFDEAEISGLATTFAYEINKGGFSNRSQNLRGSMIGKLLNLLQGYSQNENTKLGLAWAKAAGNPPKMAELRTLLKFIIPLILTIMLFGTLISAPLIYKMVKIAENRRRNQPELADAENAADVIKTILMSSAALFPMIGQFFNSMVVDTAPGRGLAGSNYQLFPLAVVQNWVQTLRQMYQTGEIVRPALAHMMQYNRVAGWLINRLPFMEGWMAIQNDVAAQRRHTTSDVEQRKQTAGAPAQYSPAWGQIQRVKNEIGKANPDYDVIRQERDAGAAKYTAKGSTDGYQSFDRAVLASNNKYLNIYGRELTPAEKVKIDAKKTPEELAESNRIDGNVQQYAQTFGAAVLDFVRTNERGQRGTGGSSGGSATGTSLTTRELTGGSVGRIGGGDVAGPAPRETGSTGSSGGTGLSRGTGLRRPTLSRGVRRISSGTRRIRVPRLRQRASGVARVRKPRGIRLRKLSVRR